MGPFIKDVRTKYEKLIHTPLARKMSALLQTSSHSALPQTSSSFPCGHTINFLNSEVFCIKKFGQPHLQNPHSYLSKNCPRRTTLLTAEVFYQLLQLQLCFFKYSKIWKKKSNYLYLVMYLSR